MNTEALGTNRERAVAVFTGWIALPIAILLLVGGVTVFIYSIVAGVNELKHPLWLLFVLGLIGVIIGILMMPGFFTLQPNEARVLILFGAYRGTVRVSGFHWGNPFYSNGGQPSGATRRLAEGEVNVTKSKLPGGLRQRRSQSRHRVSLRARTQRNPVSGLRPALAETSRQFAIPKPGFAARPNAQRREAQGQ